MTSTMTTATDTATTGGVSAFQRQAKAALPFVGMPYMREFLDQLIAEGRKGGHIRLTRAALHHFTEYMATMNVINADEIERRHLVRYQGWVNQQAWQPSYRLELLKKVRQWLAWLTTLQYIENDPWVKIRMGVTIKKPNPLSDDELDQLFTRHRNDAFNATPFSFHRRELILVLLLGWGLRIHELVALDMEDMDTNRDYVRAINKGGSTKTLPYLEEMKNSFRRYTTWRARHLGKGQDETAVFINPTSGKRMTTGDVWTVIHTLGERAGVSVNPHRFRDTCGTNLLDADMPAERVMIILGHKRLEQTLAYSRVNNHKVAESLDAAMSVKINGLIFGRTRDLGKVNP